MTDPSEGFRMQFNQTTLDIGVTEHPHHNSEARRREDVLGGKRPQSISAASWNRPFTFYVVRTDDGRWSHLDDHEEGRIVVRGFRTRRNAAGHKGICERYGGEYVVAYEPNPTYENSDGKNEHPQYPDNG
jgi:hypothetical protein